MRWVIERDFRNSHNANNLACLGGEASVAIHSSAVNGHLETEAKVARRARWTLLRLTAIFELWNGYMSTMQWDVLKMLSLVQLGKVLLRSS